MKKKLTGAIIAAMLLISVVPNIAAYQDTSTLQEFAQIMEPFYTGDKAQYSIVGKDGQSITAIMYDETYQDALSGDWEKIYEYFRQNVSCIQRDTLEKDTEQVARADLSVAFASSTFIVNLVPVGGPPHYQQFTNSYVTFCIKSNIYYDQNTFKISSTTQNKIHVFSTEDAVVVSTSVTPRIAANRYSVTFDAQLHLQLVLDDGGLGVLVVDFAPVNRSATYFVEG